MIREDRDYRFWQRVVDHPEVKPHVGLGQDLDMAAAMANPAVTPLRSENGGFLFLRLDHRGKLQELHTMYLPQGWGREVFHALAAAVEEMFTRGADLIVTTEVDDNWRSRPPKTFRFEPSGSFAPAPGFTQLFRTWHLTRAAWDASPARRRI